MSGWIKKEKDLRDDPRVRRMALRLASHFELRTIPHMEGCNARPLQGVTVWVSFVLGALDQLWMHADTFAREDDTLEATLEELDDLVGLPGFCGFMPLAWLEQLPDGRVKLPKWQAKNGPAARAAALSQQRVARHRASRAVKRDGVTDALPDQTRPDQTKTAETERQQPPRACRLPSTFLLTPQRRGVALEQQIDPERTFKKFCMYWQHTQGPTAMKRDWDKAWRQWCERERPEPGAKPTPTPEETAAGIADFERRRELARLASPVVAGPPPPPGVARR